MCRKRPQSPALRCRAARLQLQVQPELFKSLGDLAMWLFACFCPRPDGLGIECEAEHSVWLCFDFRFAREGIPEGWLARPGVRVGYCCLRFGWYLILASGSWVAGQGCRFIGVYLVAGFVKTWVVVCFIVFCFSLVHVWKVHDC